MTILSKEEINSKFIKSIEKERIKLGYSQKLMAKALDISLSTYKNMINGLPVNIPIYSSYLAYKLTGKFCFELCEVTSSEIEAIKAFKDLPEYRQKTLRAMVEVEKALHTEPLEAEEDYVDCYSLISENKDSMVYNSTGYAPVNVSAYRPLFSESIDSAIKILSNKLHPLYSRGDIILIHQEMPREGDVGIFLNKVSHKVYFRRLKEASDYIILESITDTAKPITIPDAQLKEWFIFGYILTKMR